MLSKKKGLKTSLFQKRQDDILKAKRVTEHKEIGLIYKCSFKGIHSVLGCSAAESDGHADAILPETPLGNVCPEIYQSVFSNPENAQRVFAESNIQMVKRLSPTAKRLLKIQKEKARIIKSENQKVVSFNFN